MPPSSTISGSTAAPTIIAGAAVPVNAAGAAKVVIRIILGLATKWNPLTPDSFKRGNLPPDQAKVPPLNQKPLNEVLTNPPPLGEETATGDGGNLKSTVGSSNGMDP